MDPAPGPRTPVAQHLGGLPRTPLKQPSKALNCSRPQDPHAVARLKATSRTMTSHTLVIGAGIAGLSAAWRLCARGLGDVTVVDREPLAFSHSSARNAAIFRPLEESVATVRLVARSAELLGGLSPRLPLVSRVGLCLTASDAKALGELRRVADEQRVTSERLDGDALRGRCPALDGSHAAHGLWLPDGGVLDIHQLSQLLLGQLRQAGATLRLATEARHIVTRADKAVGVELASGEVLSADRVVIAAGAWATELGRSCGAPLRLTPHRRHLALLLPTGARRLDPAHPVVWNVESGVYFRPESNGILACPGDHEPALPGVPLVNEQIVATLADKLPREAPLFDTYALARPWACLRTMSDTKQTVLGPDPRVPGLFWLAGMGGHGMSAALGAADVLVDSVLQNTLPDWCRPLLVQSHLAATRSPATEVTGGA